MVILRSSEIRKLGGKELEDKVTELKKELMKLRSQISTGTLPESPGKVKEIKRTLARINTIQNQRTKEVQSK